MDKIVLFGGTFDPIHNAHLRIAKYVSEKLNAQVIFVPAKNPRWKNPVTDVMHRVNILSLAINSLSNENITMSTYEINKNDEINYSIDTVKYFVNKYIDKDIYFLIGLDQVENFHKWKEATKLASLCHVSFVSRDDVNVDNGNIEKYQMLNLKFDKAGNISSSDIRHLRRLDTPFEVIQYIEKNNLYYMDKVRSYYNERRFKHALSVANLAMNIAKSNNFDNYGDYYIAGLLHDIAKSLDLSNEKLMMDKIYKEYTNDVNNKLYHQFLGAYLANKDFAITNQEILNAIKYHASGIDHMSSMGEIIYSSDKIDPLRGYDSKEMISLCMKDYHQGFLKVLKENKKYLLEKKISMNNSLTRRCIKYYLGENI